MLAIPRTTSSGSTQIGSFRRQSLKLSIIYFATPPFPAVVKCVDDIRVRDVLVKIETGQTPS